MAFGLEKKLKERCDIFLLVFIGVSRRTGTNVECPREMNLGSLEELLWIIVMYLRIDLYFSRNICNILIISQMPFSVYMSRHSWMNSWEWHLGRAWRGWGDLGDLRGEMSLPKAGANSWPSGIIAHEPSLILGSRSISSLRDKGESPPVLNQGAAIFIRLGEWGPEFNNGKSIKTKRT